MTASTAFRTFSFAFGAAFAILYPIAIKLDLALFTVYPALGIVLLGTHHSYDVNDPAIAFVNPAMYWYGWMATAALGALVAVVTALLPERWLERAVGVVCVVAARSGGLRLPHLPVVPGMTEPMDHGPARSRLSMHPRRWPQREVGTLMRKMTC